MNRADLPYLFMREHQGGVPAIILTRRDEDGCHERIWAVTFDEMYQRESIFSWLERHMLNWPLWGAIAASRGPDAFSEQLVACAKARPDRLRSAMIQVDRAAAYLGWSEQQILRFRDRDDCQALFEEEPDPLLIDGWITFVDLGGLVRQMIDDAEDAVAGERH